MSLWSDGIDVVCAWLKSPFIMLSRRFYWTGYTKRAEDIVADKFPTAKDFLLAFKPYAMAVEIKYGIPWLITATQAAHESRNGNSMLTLAANNLFGMTGDSWQKEGKPVYVIQTKEYNAAHIPYFISRPFRKYADWTEAVQDWVLHIIRLYPAAYADAHLNDPAGFFADLQAGGYATDPQYAAQLRIRYFELQAIVSKIATGGTK